jgi:hypothetical protein
MQPIRLHLDTSDYAAMYCALPGSPAATVRDFLKRMAALGKIQIGLSYHVVFELLQKAAPQYREDRIIKHANGRHQDTSDDIELAADPAVGDFLFHEVPTDATGPAVVMPLRVVGSVRCTHQPALIVVPLIEVPEGLSVAMGFPPDAVAR